MNTEIFNLEKLSKKRDELKSALSAPFEMLELSREIIIDKMGIFCSGCDGNCEGTCDGTCDSRCEGCGKS